jgi:hypothetical protein
MSREILLYYQVREDASKSATRHGRDMGSATKKKKKRRRWKPVEPKKSPKWIWPPEIRSALGQPPDPRWLHGIDQLLQHYHKRYDPGDKLALFQALDIYALFFPAWARTAFRTGWSRYRGYEAATLDDAFGVKRRKGQHLDKARERERLRELILFRVYCLYYQENAPLDGETFAKVGRELGINGSTVAQIFGEPASDALRELLRNLRVSYYSEND